MIFRAIKILRSLRKLSYSSTVAAAGHLLRQGKSFQEISGALDEISARFVKKKISVFSPSTGLPRDPEKYGKVFSSREEMEGSYLARTANPFSFMAKEAEKEKISRLKKEGWIDRDEIVKSYRLYDSKLGIERVVWELKDGRRVFRDEYE